MTDKPKVLIVDDDDEVAIQMVIIDRAIGNKWLISSGLNPGDRVVVEGIQKVRPGASVKVVPYNVDNKDNMKTSKKIIASDSDNKMEN